jgi:hypothetical protein
MMIRAQALGGPPLKISLILPLFDRRNAGWKPLESAVSQTIERSQYEVIAVVGRTFTDDLANDAHARELVQGCDAVVHVDADPNRLDQEIPFLLAGYERSVGDVLLFLEGHTELAKYGCAMIAAYFRDNPRSRIAWAPRVHRSKSALGLLIGMHSKRHERRARERGGFWLGGNSVITRELFEQMGRLEAGYMRFGERVFFDRIVREGIAIGRLAMPLSTHYDDMPVSKLIGVAAAAGEARFKYYNFPGPVEVRHRIYLQANHDASALVLFPLAWGLRAVFLRAAIGLCRLNRTWAYRFYVLGFGFADLSGFCKARLRAARERRDSAPAPGSSSEFG